jgi:hypothetical protein
MHQPNASNIEPIIIEPIVIEPIVVLTNKKVFVSISYKKGKGEEGRMKPRMEWSGMQMEERTKMEWSGMQSIWMEWSGMQMEERTKKRRGAKLGPELGGRPRCRDKKERREEERS